MHSCRYLPRVSTVPCLDRCLPRLPKQIPFKIAVEDDGKSFSWIVG